MDDYTALVRSVAEAHRSEIEGDLILARAMLDRSRGEVRECESRVQSLQALLDLLASPSGSPEGEQRMTLHDAMAEVLRTAPEQMMRAGDLAAEIQRRRLYQMRDGRPVEPQQIHARA
jgi:hypothetical protein